MAESSTTGSPEADPSAMGSPSAAAMLSPGSEALRPVARTAADILAVMPHTLGCWPRSSAVLLTATSTAPGPCLRVDLPDRRMLSDEIAVLEWTAELSQLLEHDRDGDRIYLGLFVEGADLGEPQLARLVEAVGEAGALSGHVLGGAWEIGPALWRDLEQPEGDGWRCVEQIRTSALWTAMVVAGSTVERCGPGADQAPSPSASSSAASPQSSRPAGACPPGDGDLRVEDCQALVRELERRRSGRGLPGDDEPRCCAPEHLGLWERLLRPASVEPLERLAALGPAGQADLLQGLSDPVGGDALLGAVVTGDFERARRAWEEFEETDPDDEAGEHLRWLVGVLVGQWAGAPGWVRIASFEAVLEALLDMLHAAPEAAAVEPEVLRRAEAAIWIATAQVERFRARGSCAQRWLQLAEEAVPGHPGAARVRELAARYPVPRWATDPATAWHRGR